eukprot:SAG31_NODE_3236_length_4509_cov_2.012472_1_plen_166_part_10
MAKQYPFSFTIPFRPNPRLKSISSLAKPMISVSQKNDDAMVRSVHIQRQVPNFYLLCFSPRFFRAVAALLTKYAPQLQKPPKSRNIPQSRLHNSKTATAVHAQLQSVTPNNKLHAKAPRSRPADRGHEPDDADATPDCDADSHKAVVQQQYLLRIPRKITLLVDRR